MARETWDCVILGVEEVEAGFRRIGRARQEAEGRGSAGGGAGRSTDTALQAASRRAERQAASEGRAAERAAAQKARAAERAAKAEMREAERSAKAQERLSAKVAKEAEKDREHVFRIRQRYHEREERLEKQRVNAAYQRRQRMSAAFLGGVAGGITSGIVRLGSRGVRAVMGTAEEATREQLDIDKLARRISINARAPGAAAIDPKVIGAELRSVSESVRRAVSPEQVGESIRAFISKTGETAKAREFAPDIAEIAVAADADVKAVGKTAADLFEKFGIQTREDMQKALASLYFGGKAAALELPDFAEKMAPIASAGRRFGVDKGVRGVQVVSGLAQIAMKATGERDVAATAVGTALAQIVANQDRIKKLTGGKVSVFDKKANATRPIEELLPEIIARTGGLDASKKAAGLLDIFGIRGIKAVDPLISAFTEAAKESKAAGGTKEQQMAAGKMAVSSTLDTAINATGAWSEVLKDSQDAQSTSSAKLNNAWGLLKDSIGEKLLPKVDELADKIPDFAEGIAEVTVLLGDLAKGMGSLLDMVGFKEIGAGRRAEREAMTAGKDITSLQEIAKKRNLTPSEKLRLEKAQTIQAGSSREAEFIQQYLAADTSNTWMGDPRISAKKMWDKLQQEPAAATTYAETFSHFQIPGLVSGQNPAQLALINQEANRRQVELERTKGVSEVSGAKEAEVGLAAFVRSLNAATRAADNLAAKAEPTVFAGG